MTKIKPIAVHVHLFYTDMWDELSVQLNNIKDTPYHLYVTLTNEDSVLIKKIKQFHPASNVFIVPNMGYDIGPFIEFLNKINLDEYSYILKLHSKRPTNGPDTKIKHLPITRYYWKVLLSEALIGSEKIWQNNINQFEKNSQLGMIGSPHLIKKIDNCDKPLLPELEKQLNRLNLNIPNNFSFIAGTMFIVRSQLLKVIQNNYSIEDFQTTDGAVKDGTFAHVFERLFGAIIIAQDHTIKGFSHNYMFVFSAICKIIGRFFYQRKTTKHNKILIKVCKIPVFQKSI
jgi:lipopolysaccharide biosynthesis protein